jgi:hypothetical protein
MSSPLVPYEVTNAYESLIEEFRNAVAGANGKVFPGYFPIQSCFVRSQENGKVIFKLGLYLKGCPCTKLPGKKRLDVQIKVLETLEKASWALTKSTVYLNYFILSKSKLQPVRLLHFDFQEGGQTRHPLFHVQMMDEVIPEDIGSFGADIEPRMRLKSNQESIPSRIPTSEMTVASVLYCLAADHLGDGKFGEFAKRVCAIQSRLPKLRFEALKKSLNASKDFKSSHWFAHDKDAA